MTAGNDVEIAPNVHLPEDKLPFSFSRGGGPGGQHVNKTSTRATLTVQLDDLAQVMPGWAIRRLRNQAGQKLAHDPDRLLISSAASRSQHANRKKCLEKLRELLVRALHRPKRRRRTRPPRWANEKRLRQKKQRGQLKARRQDNPRPPGP